MKVSELTDGQRVICRTGRAGRTCVEWDGDWHEETLYIRRRPNGELLTISLRSKVWAEGDMRDYSDEPEGGCFTVEDWYLLIQGLTI